MIVLCKEKSSVNMLEKHLLLCSTEVSRSYRFRTTWRWLNYSQFFIPLKEDFYVLAKKKNIKPFKPLCIFVVGKRLMFGFTQRRRQHYRGLVPSCTTATWGSNRSNERNRQKLMGLRVRIICNLNFINGKSLRYVVYRVIALFSFLTCRCWQSRISNGPKLSWLESRVCATRESK